MQEIIEGIVNKLDHQIPVYRYYGIVSAIKGMLIEVKGLSNIAAIDSHCLITTRYQEKVLAEVVGADGEKVFLIPYAATGGIGVGCEVEFLETGFTVAPHISWRGRVINAFAEPIDGKGLLKTGNKKYQCKASPILAHKRQMVGGKIDIGVKALNIFTSCCRGQRMGIFAGSGVGKSVLTAMMTKYSSSEVKVIGLIGERGRELQEFIENYLGAEGLEKAIIIAATSDESAVMRRQAAYLTMTVAEYFRDLDMDVLCIMDSVTRFAMAQREIGLSLGEPPTTKGYTPTVFAELPKLLERAGPGSGKGSITGLFSVLVEGDDNNEPIADAVRGILDGHVVLDRKIAERGRLPAVNILRSLSRTMPACNNPEENAIVSRARKIIAIYEDMAEMIRLGAYRRGSNPEVDEAINYYSAIEDFLTQLPDEHINMQESYHKLAEILGMTEK